MASDNLAGESRASQVQAACIAFFVLSPLFVGARIFARVKVRSWSGLSWDDGTLVVGWIFSIILSAMVMLSCASGFGKHIETVTDFNDTKDLSLILKYNYLAEIFYKLSINTTKASIILFYLRRFVTNWFKIACYVMLGVVLSFMVATTVGTIAQCTPIEKSWLAPGGSCIDIKAFWYANSGISILINVIMLALPFQPIHASSLPGGQKVALTIVFAIGAFTTITGVIRMQTFEWAGLDYTYNVDWLMWTVIETNLAILCGCVPVYRPLMAYIFPKQFATTSKIRPGDNRRNTLAVFSRSEVSLAPSARAKRMSRISIMPHRKPGGWDHDSEKGLDDLPLPAPPGIRDPNAPPRRSSMLRDAYVWLNTVI
ncbi:hypothetical protein B0T16DRAFT_123092 [Cercophora newfieldiana]|uniref:Rhodopsin domain-containing protein n=1 Tax=Cercophora newfieldiana TaxID=92897 RepID=A0AA39YCF6_9PEZI|nr:hypothetical protein B0T16DRAFT_123092 [Cercophora newfieldiana]